MKFLCCIGRYGTAQRIDVITDIVAVPYVAYDTEPYSTKYSKTWKEEERCFGYYGFSVDGSIVPLVIEAVIIIGFFKTLLVGYYV